MENMSLKQLTFIRLRVTNGIFDTTDSALLKK